MPRCAIPRRPLLTAVATLAAGASWLFVGPIQAAAADIRIAHIHSLTGPLEAYGKQTTIGFNLGIEYATGGTMMVAGKKLVVIEKDDQGKPDVGKSLLAAAYGDDKVDIAVGPTSSGVALAMLPVAEEYKKILVVEPAVADSITGDKWNKYIFRTGRNSSQDAISNAVALDRPGTVIATLAQDYAFGRDGVKAFKEALKSAKIVHEEYLPQNTTDFTAGIQRVVDALKGQSGRKVIEVIWAGGTPPYNALAAQEPAKRHGIEVFTGGNILPAMAAYKNFPGMEGATYYYFGIPKNWSPTTTSSTRRRRTSSPPVA
jgi:branched-chain amino acid transport system substrate-binding protein